MRPVISYGLVFLVPVPYHPRSSYPVSSAAWQAVNQQSIGGCHQQRIESSVLRRLGSTRRPGFLVPCPLSLGACSSFSRLRRLYSTMRRPSFLVHGFLQWAVNYIASVSSSLTGDSRVLVLAPGFLQWAVNHIASSFQSLGRRLPVVPSQSTIPIPNPVPFPDTIGVSRFRFQDETRQFRSSFKKLPTKSDAGRDGRYNRFVTGKVLNRYRSDGLPVTSYDADTLGKQYTIRIL